MKNLDYNIEGADCGRFPAWPQKAAQAEKLHERKDAHRKPQPPHLTGS